MKIKCRDFFTDPMKLLSPNLACGAMGPFDAGALAEALNRKIEDAAPPVHDNLQYLVFQTGNYPPLYLQWQFYGDDEPTVFAAGKHDTPAQIRRKLPPVVKRIIGSLQKKTLDLTPIKE